MTNTKKTQPLPENSGCPFRSAYSPRVRVAISFPAQGRTKQSFKTECDINTIMSRYLKTGMVDFVNKHSPQYHDVTGVDYQEALQVVAESQSLFNDLPAQLRGQFKNDPALFLDFVSDPTNRPEMARMGLLRPEVARTILAAPTPPKPAPALNAGDSGKPQGLPEGEKPAPEGAK